MKLFTKTLKIGVLLLLFSGSSFAVDRVDINIADAAELSKMLVNIGPSKAQAIIDYRENHGKFKSAEQLALVRGIGLQTIEKNRDRIAIKTQADIRSNGVKPVAVASEK